MSDLADTVEAIFTTHCSDKVRLDAEAGVWPAALWQAVDDAGLPLALVDAGPGALGVAVAEAFGIVRLAGAHAVPLPLPETMLAQWLLARAGLAPRQGPAVLAAKGGAATPWGGQLLHGRPIAIIELRPDGLAVHEHATLKRTQRSIAHEPRNDVDLADAAVTVPYPTGISPLALHAAMAALRTAQIAGAIDWITRATVDYANTRVQFGKPIAKFQAIQHSIAVLAEHAAASAAAADMAADAFANGIDVPAIAAAKTFAGEAAGIAAGLAHQVHGAIGFSRAFALHHRTRRLWAWRDEAGNEAYWAQHLGAHLAGQTRAALWQEITRL